MPDTKYTPGAMKAAKVIFSTINANTVLSVAEIITRETGDKEMGEALQRIVKVLHTVTEDDDGVTYFNGRYCGELQAPLAEAKAILRKAGLL